MNIVIKNRLPEIQRLLHAHPTLSIMGMPGGGISILLKELARTNTGHSVYIDVFGLPALSSEDLFRNLATELGITKPCKDLADTIRACVDRLQELTRSSGRVVIYFAGFDQLADALDAQLLQGLQALTRNNSEVRLVFGLCISLKKLIPDAYFDSGLRLFSNKYYIGGYSPAELRYWLGLYGPENWENTSDLDAKLALSGGHLQLLLLLLGNRPEINDGQNESISLLFKNLYQLLLGPQRTIVRSLGQGKKAANDEYLSGIGMVNRKDELFSPLFVTYLRAYYRPQLPAKERRLFLLLKKHLGQTVSKQVIMDTVWQDDIVSDWALNALVYRLRKHPAFLSRNLVIENHKKLGYALVRPG